MNQLSLLPVGPFDRGLLEDLSARLLNHFRARIEVLEPWPVPDFAYNAERRQYHSSDVLNRMGEQIGGKAWRILALTQCDLYIPILTFVFGEAQLGGRNAIVSAHRLHQEFYGLPVDSDMLKLRLIKEAVHELGHTLELTHCRDYGCVMASSHSVEWIDLKDSGLCEKCQGKVLARYSAGAR